MRKKVWIWNHYATNTYFDQGGRHYNFAKFLVEAGYEPVIFCATTVHNSSQQVDIGDACWMEKADSVCPYVFIKARPYTGNGKQRVLNMVDFYRSVKKAARGYAKVHGKPDIIYASSVHPLTLVAGIQMARRFGVKCICEVRDLWPETIVTYSNRFTRDHPLMRLLYQGEKWIYRRADALIFTMEGAYDYIIERGWEGKIPRAKVHYINNGMDLAAFDENRARYTVQDPDLADPSVFKVVYTGSIRKVNHLGLLLDAAKEVTDPRVKFLIWGDGDQRAALEQRVREEEISNVVFKGKVEKKYIPSIVSRADINLAHNDPSPLFRFGISFNKLFDYLAAGKPVLCDFPCPYNPAIQCGAGISVDAPSSGKIAAAVESMSALPQETYQQYCSAARAAAEKYDFRVLTQKLLAVIQHQEAAGETL